MMALSSRWIELALLIGGISLAIQQPSRPIETLVAEFQAAEARKVKTAPDSETRAMAAREQASLAEQIAWRLYSNGDSTAAGAWLGRQAASRRESVSIWLALVEHDINRLDTAAAALQGNPAESRPWIEALLMALEVNARALRAGGFDSEALDKLLEKYKTSLRTLDEDARKAVPTFIEQANLTNRRVALMLAGELRDTRRLASLANDHLQRRRHRLEVLRTSTATEDVAAAKVQLADALRTIAGIERSNAEYRAAEARYLEALEIERTLPDDHEQRRVADTLRELAGALRDAGQSDLAEQRLRESLAELQRLSVSAKATPTPSAAALNAERLDPSGALLALGNLQSSRGQYGAALETYAQAQQSTDKLLATLKQLASSDGRIAALAVKLESLKPVIQGYVAGVYADMGDLPRAARELDAIDLDRLMKADGESDVVAAALFARARVEAVASERDDRTRSLAMLLAYYQSNNNIVGIISTEIRLATMLSTTHPDEAARHAQSALALATNPQDIVRAAVALAEIELDRGRPQDAAPLLARWRDHSTRYGARLEAATLVVEGRLKELAGDVPAAVSLYQRAIDRVESLQAPLMTSDRFFDVRSNHEPYERMIHVRVRQKRVSDAVAYITRQQVRDVRDANGLRALRSPDAEIQRLLDRAVALRAQIGQLATASSTASVFSTDAERAQSIDRAAAAAVGEWQQVIAAISAKDRNLGDYLTGAVSDLSEIRKALPPRTAIVIFSAPMDTALYAFVLTAKTERVRESPVPPREVWALVKRFRSSLDAQTLKTSDLEALERLYEALITPIDPELREIDRIFVLPTRGLHYVPLQALVRRQGGARRFLVEDKEIVTLVPGPREARQQSPALSPRSTVTAFANPTGDLRLAEVEAKAISDVFASTTILTREQATKSAVHAAGTGRNILHFAAHGYLIPSAPTMSYLALAGRSLEERRLTVGEIRGLSLDDVRLVTLSACDAARAQDDPRGVELSTLSDAFMTAGAETVVGTLWKVPEDTPTVQVMSRFYRQLAGGACESAALRTAQLEALKRSPDPQAWASFVVFRNWSRPLASACR